jgi:hypothetical protein
MNEPLIQPHPEASSSLATAATLARKKNIVNLRCEYENGDEIYYKHGLGHHARPALEQWPRTPASPIPSWSRNFPGACCGSIITTRWIVPSSELAGEE